MTNTRNTAETKLMSHAQLTDYRTKAQKEKKILKAVEMKSERSNKMGQKLIPCVPIYRFASCDSSSKQLQVPINNFAFT